MMSIFIFVFLSLCLGTQGLDDCPVHMFSCNDEARTCIRNFEWCNGDFNCPNRYDEMYCNQRRTIERPEVCPKGMFSCADMGCFPQKGRCDGFKSCKDGSDEENCGYSNQDQRRRPPQLPGPSFFLPDVEDYDHQYDEDDDDYSREEKRAVEWVLEQRNDYAWGDDTERAIVALSLSSQGHLGTDEKKDELLMIKSLHLRISLAIPWNVRKTSLSHRALLINALNASCGDPRDFYGVDLVADLRGSINSVHRRNSPDVAVAPIVYLTLCLADVTMPDDIERMKFEIGKLKTSVRNDLKALFLLTTVCMEKQNVSDEHARFLGKAKRFLVKNLTDSDAENIYELALVTQALNAAKVNPHTWDRKEKMEFILKHQKEDGSFRDMLATYYVMPLLTKKSLLSIGGNCVNLPHNDHLETQKSLRDKMNVNYTLNFGLQNVSQTMFLSVSNGSTIYDVMMLAERRNNNFRFSVDDKKKAVPLVYSIGGVPNDAEKGLFWNVEVSRLHSHHKYIIYHPEVSSIKTHVLQDRDAIIFSMQAYKY